MKLTSLLSSVQPTFYIKTREFRNMIRTTAQTMTYLTRLLYSTFMIVNLILYAWLIGVLFQFRNPRIGTWDWRIRPGPSDWNLYWWSCTRHFSTLPNVSSPHQLILRSTTLSKSKWFFFHFCPSDLDFGPKSIGKTSDTVSRFWSILKVSSQ